MASFDFGPLTKNIKETEEWLVRELSSVRTGRATPSILDTVKPEAYGTRSPVSQIASVTIEDARSLRIVPWDKSLTKNIEKAIQDADLGVGLATDDQGLRVTFPELTAERRAMLLKVANDKLEQARVTLRGHRTDTLKALDAVASFVGDWKAPKGPLVLGLKPTKTAGLDDIDKIMEPNALSTIFGFTATYPGTRAGSAQAGSRK